MCIRDRYNIDSRKSLVAGWELAGPFGQSNALGMYCAMGFSLVPLVKGLRWQAICAVILLSTIVLSATRTALIASGFVVLWWILSWLRPLISIRLVGTLFAGLAVCCAVTIPLMHWDPHAFTERPVIWSTALRWIQESPIVGMGFNWFLTYGPLTRETAVWANFGTGHNILIDTLVKTGLVGVALLMPIWLRAIVAAGAFRVTNVQIACFGYLIAFFVMATLEAVWDLWPTIQQFPTSGLIFATLIMARDGDEATRETV